MLKASAIFFVTYIMISGLRFRGLKLGRTAGAMLGVLLMVVFKVVSPEHTYELVNWNTIVLLLGMMIVIEHLAEADFFKLLAEWIDEKNFSLKRLLFFEIFGVGLLSAFLVNDIVCIFVTPLLLIMMRRKNLPAMPFLLGIATSSNIGGSMAFTGNPQNMIIGSLSGIPYHEYFLLMLPIGLIGLLINYLLICRIFKAQMEESDTKFKDIEAESEQPKEKKNPLLYKSLAVTALIIVGFFAFKDISWVALAGATLLLFIANRDENRVLTKIDWNLLLFFALLFIVVGALNETGVTSLALGKVSGLFDRSLAGFVKFGAVTVLGSNIFGNVPYVLIVAETISQLKDNSVFWYLLAYVSTIAGNMTIIGSVANIIVVERARGFCNIGILDFVKVGVPSTAINLALGIGIIYIYNMLGLL